MAIKEKKIITPERLSLLPHREIVDPMKWHWKSDWNKKKIKKEWVLETAGSVVNVTPDALKVCQPYSTLKHLFR